MHIPFTGKLFLRVPAAKGIYEYVIARTKYIDAVFRQPLSDIGGAQQAHEPDGPKKRPSGYERGYVAIGNRL